MTDEQAEELNTAVARTTGWAWHEGEEGTGDHYWTLPDGGVKDAPNFGADYGGKRYGDFYALPDFARDTHALGWLLDWVESEKLFCSVDQDVERRYGVFVHGHFGDGNDPDEYYDTLGEAMCRAILAYASAKAAMADAKNRCGCRYSDAWRCAVDMNLATVSCHCLCHRPAWR